MARRSANYSKVVYPSIGMPWRWGRPPQISRIPHRSADRTRILTDYLSYGQCAPERGPYNRRGWLRGGVRIAAGGVLRPLPARSLGRTSGWERNQKGQRLAMRPHRAPRGRLASLPGGYPRPAGPGGGCDLREVPSVQRKTRPPGAWLPEAVPMRARRWNQVAAMSRRGYFPRVSGG